MSIEESFAKLVGRPPSEKERLRLSHIRDALDVRDNDALWAIIMAYELYDSLFAAYPAKIADEAKQIMERARETYAAAAEAEAAKCHNALAMKVAETSVEIAKKLAEKPIGIHQVTAGFAKPLYVFSIDLIQHSKRRFTATVAGFPSIRIDATTAGEAIAAAQVATLQELVRKLKDGSIDARTFHGLVFHVRSRRL